MLSINGIGTKTGGRNRFFFRYFLLFSTLVFCIFQVNIQKIYGFSIYPDEFGYWASAAQMLGWDWTDTVALGSYYSYGYSLLLAPILWIFRDSVAAYRGAVALNMLLQCGAVGILWTIFERLSPAENAEEKRMQAVLAVGVAVFYPPWLFYMQMTMTEALLMFLFALVCYQILRFVEKPGIAGGVFLGLTLVYMYFVHMRTVAILIAAVLTLTLYAWRVPSARKKVAVLLILLAVGAVCGIWVKGRVVDAVYAATEMETLAINDSVGKFGILKSIFTVFGMKRFISSMAGKLYYLVLAAFGLTVPAVCICLKKSLHVFRDLISRADAGQPETSYERDYFYVFCLFSLMGQTAVSAMVAMWPGRLDSYIYGRYSEYMLPVLMGIGLLAWSGTKHRLRIFTGSAVISAVLFAVTFRNVLHSGLTVMQGYFAPGLNYLSEDWNYEVKAEFWKAYLFGLCLMTGVAVCIHIGKRSGKYVYALAGFLLMETLLAFRLEGKYISYFNDVNYYNLRIAAYMEEQEDPVVYLYGGGFPYIDLIQFAMREKKIEIIWLEDLETASGNEAEINETESLEWESILPEEGFLLVDQGSPYRDELQSRYQECVESQAFVLLQIEKK